MLPICSKIRYIWLAVTVLFGSSARSLLHFSMNAVHTAGFFLPQAVRSEWSFDKNRQSSCVKSKMCCDLRQARSRFATAAMLF